MNHILPGEFQDNAFGLPTGFLSNHTSIQAAEGCNTQLLPNIPTCPGPYLRLFPTRLVRPASTHHFQVTHSKANLLYNKVIAFGQPNYLGAKEIINPDFPIQMWETQLVGYHDQQVIIFMKYGWPTGFMGNSIPKLDLPNHTSSRRQPLAVEKFLQKEVSLGGIMGPFVVSPFAWVRINPLMARPKKDSDQQRIILDLSFPEGESVNSAIPRVLFEGSPFKLHLPTPLELAELIVKKGANCFLYKVDLSRAYRQLPIDPFDWPLLGIAWDSKIFIDLAIPFGLRHGAMACQRATEAVCYVLKKNNDADAEPYIDDFGGVAGPDRREANNQYIAIKTILLDLGLTVAWEKCVPPTRVLTWTGTTFDTIRMLMWIDVEKVQEALTLCQKHIDDNAINFKQLEVLLYASKLAAPARRFLNSTLALKRCLPEKGNFAIPSEVVAELQWFIHFLPHYNGKAMIRSRTTPTIFMFTDASLVGGGAFVQDYTYFTVKWPPPLLEWNLSISDLEIYTVLLAVRTWSDFLSGTTFLVKSDNEATVVVIKSGKTRSLFMADCLKELWFLCASADIDLLISHISGKDNVTADLLSRRFLSPSHKALFRDFQSSTSLIHTNIPTRDITPPQSMD